MKTVICHCDQCRAHRGTRAALVRSKRKSMRGQCRWLLRAGQWDKLPSVIVVSYTDLSLYARVLP